MASTHLSMASLAFSHLVPVYSSPISPYLLSLEKQPFCSASTSTSRLIALIYCLDVLLS